MVEITKKYYCDICKNEGAKQYKTLAKFHTEQTEGRVVTPYATNIDIDLCNDCLDKVIVINGEGAQGNNIFWLNKK